MLMYRPKDKEPDWVQTGASEMNQKVRPKAGGRRVLLSSYVAAAAVAIEVGAVANAAFFRGE